MYLLTCTSVLTYSLNEWIRKAQSVCQDRPRTCPADVLLQDWARLVFWWATTQRQDRFAMIYVYAPDAMRKKECATRWSLRQAAWFNMSYEQ